MTTMFEVSTGTIVRDVNLHDVQYRRFVHVETDTEWIHHKEWDEVHRFAGVQRRDSLDEITLLSVNRLSVYSVLKTKNSRRKQIWQEKHL